MNQPIKDERKELIDNLSKIALAYTKHVDKTITDHSDESPEKLYEKANGKTLNEAITETLTKSNYVDFKKLGLNIAKTAGDAQYAMTGYDKYRHGSYDRNAKPWHKNKNDNVSTIMKSQLTNVVTRLDKATHIAKSRQSSKNNTHYVTETSDLKKGDVIQLYQPYTSALKTHHTKNTIDMHGQNRYYGIIQPLPNGDFLAVDFRGHRNLTKDSVLLNYDPKYAFPTSKNVKATLDITDHRLIQLPKEAIIKGTKLREKYEAASYGKVYDATANGNDSIKVLKMSPENEQKMNNYISKINNYEQDIAWHKTHNEVVGRTTRGRNMLQPMFLKNATVNLKTGVYEQRDRTLTQRITRQEAIRDAKYGPNSAAVIRTKSQQNKMNAQRHANERQKTATSQALSR